MQKTILTQVSAAEAQCRSEISEFLRYALKDGFDAAALNIEYPPNPSLGSFAVPCFALAKSAGVSPVEVAKSLAQQFQEKRSIEKDGHLIIRAQNYGPYLNFFTQPKKFAELVLGQVLKEKNSFGNAKLGRGQKIMIEYSQPNTHKEFHIGHLRNVCIGSSIVNFYRALGYNVTAANYIGDIGTHVAKCLWLYLKKYKNQPVPKNAGKFLGQIYVEANKLSEESPDAKKEISEVLQQLEAGDRELTQLWKKTRQWSLKEFKEIYQRLGAEFDLYFYESEVEKDGKAIVRELEKSGLAKKSEGAVVIDLEAHDLKTFLLLKSDGTSLYSTKDLALAQRKFEKYKIEKSFYVVDMRQSLYFQQLFKTLELMGFKREMKHISYEFVTLASGAMSSRTGNVVLFEDFESEMLERVLAETKKHHADWPEKKIQQVSLEIAHAAMKYTMLVHGNNTPVVFDVKKALELSGKTGPYLQYMHARISSILKKSKVRPAKKIQYLDQPEEKALIESLSRFPGVVEQCAISFDPSHLANYLFDLAKQFSSFYESVPVLAAKPEVQAELITLISAVRLTLARGMELLGLSAPETM